MSVNSAARDARIASIVIGLWLVLLTWLWPHSTNELGTTLSLGLLITVISAATLAAPQLRILTTLLALWMVITAGWAPVMGQATFANQLLAGSALFIASMVTGGMPSPRTGLRPA